MTLDGKVLASGDMDQTVKLWDAATGKEQATLKCLDRHLFAVTFSPNGRLLATAGGDEVTFQHNGIQVWDVTTKKSVYVLKGHRDAVYSLAFSPDGKFLVSAGQDTLVRLWDMETGKLKATLKGHFNQIFSVAVSSGGEWLASGGGFNGGEVRLWDLAKGQQKASYQGHTEPVRCVSFGPNGKCLVSAGGTPVDPEGILLWNLTTGKAVAGVKGIVNAVAFSPDGRTLATCLGQDGVVKLWDVPQIEKAVKP